jgi:hypothetical protein
MTVRPPQTNGVLNAIYDALAREPAADGIRISIEPTASDLPMANGKVLRSKSLCWNLTANGHDLGEPVLAVVHAGLTEEVLRSDLARYFEGYAQVVDNDIHVTED